MPATITWSGYTWDVRTGTGGPGPNIWDQANVSQAGGILALAITEPTPDEWHAVHLISQDADFGYGKYEWVVNDRLDLLDLNVTLGMYTYDDTAGEGEPFYAREIDIEASRFGDATERRRLWNVMQPTGAVQGAGGRISPDPPYHLSFVWETDQVTFEATDSTGIVMHRFVRRENVQAPAVRVMMNLWLSEANPPTDGLPVTIHIASFTHTPDATAPPVEKMHTFTDGFSGPSWAWADQSPTTADPYTIEDGTMVIPAGAALAIVSSPRVFDFVDSSALFEVIEVPDSLGNSEAEFSIIHDNSNKLRMYKRGAPGNVALACQVTEAGVTTEVAVPWSEGSMEGGTFDYFADDFASGTLDTSKWTPGGTVAIVSGQCKVYSPAAGTTYSTLVGTPHNLLESHLSSRVGVLGMSGSHEVTCELIDASNGANRLQYLLYGGDFIQSKIGVGAATNPSPPAYNAPTHDYLRWREASGTVYFEYSSTGSSWSTMWSCPSEAWMVDCFLSVTAGHWATEAGESAIILDNVNGGTAPALTPPEPTEFIWWKIKEVSGDIIFQTSIDTTSWHTVATIPHTMPDFLSVVSARFSAKDYAA